MSKRPWILLGIAFLGLVLSLPLRANTANEAIARAFSEWMTYYYIDKNPSQAGYYLKWIEDSRLLRDNDAGIASIGAFYSVLFADNPDDVAGWIRDAKPTGNTKTAVIEALWLAGQTDLIPQLFDKIPDAYQEAHPKLSQTPVRTAIDLDRAWGAFFASGKQVHIQNIVDLLGDNVKLSGNRTEDALLRRAAEWSLANNLSQHERINRLLRQEMRARAGYLKRRLEDMINRYDKYLRKLEEEDEDFSAQIAIVDPATRTRPEQGEDIMGFKDIKTIGPGKTCRISLFMTGQALTKDYRADVTYDLKVVRPDGKIHDAIDLKDEVFVTGKRAVRHQIMEKIAAPILRFTKNDPPGTYKILAHVYDKLGKRDVELRYNLVFRP